MNAIGQPPPLHRGAWGTGLGGWMLLGLVMFMAVAGALAWRERAPTLPEMIWLALIATQIVIRAPWTRRVARNPILRRDGGAIEPLLLLAMFACALILPLLAIATPLLDGHAYALPTWALLPALALSGGGLWLFHRSHVDLAANWSPTLEIRQGHHLVTHGIYARIRHPMYAAIWLMALAQPLLVQNRVAGPAVLLAFAAMYAYRVRHEEAMLRAEFKEEWLLYALRTGRLLPRMRWTKRPGGSR